MLWLLALIAWMWVWGGIILYALCNEASFFPREGLRTLRVIIGAIFWPITLPLIALIYFVGELRDWLDNN